MKIAVLDLVNSDKKAVIDARFEKLLSCYRWYLRPDGRVATNFRMKGAKPYKTLNIKLHRLLMGDPKNGLEVDHINRDPLDNRLSNLRLCDHVENSWNMKAPMGVTLFRGKKWRARIKHRGKEIHIGIFDTKEDAIKARDNLEKKLRGDFFVGCKK